MDKKNSITVIIAHFYVERDISDLLKDIAEQKINADIEICDVKGISPAGRARNDRAEKAKNGILVFLDDDVRLGNEYTLENLIKPLITDEKVAICGSSQLIPLDANNFQKKCALQIQHVQHPVIKSSQEVGMVGAACCAMRKDLFLSIGGFNADMMRGEDQEICYRLKKKGFKIIRSADTWIYHPPPKDLKEFINTTFFRAKGVACVDAHYPHLNIDTDPRGTIHPIQKRSIGYRLKRYIIRLFKAIFTGKGLLFLDRTVYFCGYIYGFVKYRILRKTSNG